jgi:hypothetical protein
MIRHSTNHVLMEFRSSKAVNEVLDDDDNMGQ